MTNQETKRDSWAGQRTFGALQGRSQEKKGGTTFLGDQAADGIL